MTRGMRREELAALLDQLLAKPPRDEAAVAEQQKYLALALSVEDKAELCLLAAEREAAAIATFMAAQQKEEQADAASRQAMAPLLRALEAQMEAASQVSQLVSLMDDHQLRGQIRFLKHRLEDTGAGEDAGEGGADEGRGDSHKH